MTLKPLFSKHYFMTQFKRYLPAAVLYTLVVFLAVPLALLIDSSKAFKHRSFVSIIIANPIMFFLLLIIPALLGLIYHYMFNVKYINHIYTLPLTRIQLYFTNLLVGYCILGIPLLINYSLVALLKLVIGSDFLPSIVSYGDILSIMLHYIFISWVIFTLSSSVATVCSSIFVHIVLIASLIALPPFIGALVDATLSTFLYGYPSTLSLLTRNIINYCPAYWLSTVIIPSGGYSDFTRSAFSLSLQYLQYALPIFLIAILVAISHNKQRHMENLHKWVSFKWVVNVLKFLACQLGSMTCLFFVIAISGNVYSSLLFIITGLGGGLIGHIIINMFLEKRLNILDSWKYFAGYSLFILIAFLTIQFNITGYKDYFPKDDEIEYVDIKLQTNNLGVSKHDPIKITSDEDIEALKKIHQFYLDYPEYHLSNIRFRETSRHFSTTIVYRLKNGKKIERHYNLNIPPEFSDLEELNNTYNQLIYNLSAIRRPLFQVPLMNNQEPADWSMELRGEKSTIKNLNSNYLEKLKESLAQEYSTMTLEQRLLHAKSRRISLCLNVVNPGTPDIFILSGLSRHYYYDQTLYITKYTPQTLAIIKENGYYDQLLYKADDFKSLMIYKRYKDDTPQEIVAEVTDINEIFDLYLNTRDDYYSYNSKAAFYYQFIFTTVTDERIYKETLNY